ncbi:hypothetical protein D910_03431 [Dendroctonus ponderosae]|uniref:DUF7041 domain-containing protein n=1 Tax=Dendroctonus ponderosae TaxID=77166 RepID=U4TYW1_DENPD|nr:hypothetical protein D910_03431 [Dendroctonus ponderosae]
MQGWGEAQPIAINLEATGVPHCISLTHTCGALCGWTNLSLAARGNDMDFGGASSEEPSGSAAGKGPRDTPSGESAHTKQAATTGTQKRHRSDGSTPDKPQPKRPCVGTSARKGTAHKSYRDAISGIKMEGQKSGSSGGLVGTTAIPLWEHCNTYIQHRYIRFYIESEEVPLTVYRNPKITDWASYKENLRLQLGDCSTEAHTVQEVSVRIPPLWGKNIRIWQMQVEAQFSNSNIVQEKTKFNHILAALESDVAEMISDFIFQLQSSQPYTDLMRQSDGRKVNKLLTELDLGDRKPSHLLREMKVLAGTQVQPDFLRAMFLQRLPNNVRAILATSSDSLDNIASMANKIMELSTPSYSTQAVVSTPTPPHDNDRISRLETQVAQLCSTINSVKPRTRSSSRSTHQPTQLDVSSFDFCWSHIKYGRKARKCTVTNLSATGKTIHNYHSSFSTLAPGLQFSNLLKEFPDITTYTGHDETNYKILTATLTEKGYSWHSYENKQNRPIKVMAKKMYYSIDPEKLLHESTLVPQCKKCQAYGHTQKHCAMEPRCVRCTGKHLTMECEKPKNENRNVLIVVKGIQPSTEDAWLQKKCQN